MTPFQFVGAVVLYFVLVFAVGCGIRLARETAMEPAWGAHLAEAIQGIALAAAILPVAWLVAWTFREATWEQLFVAGIVATILLVLADAAIGAEVRGLTPERLLFKRDSFEGAIYYGLVGLLAVAPALFSLRRPQSRRHDYAE
jgi:hypothetical protein